MEIYAKPRDGTACLRLTANRSLFGGIAVEVLFVLPLVGGFEAWATVPINRWPQGAGRWEAGVTAMPGRRPNVPDVVIRFGLKREDDVPILWKNCP
jgi:hypothetical protein